MLPLSGIRVIDLTQAWAGPYGALLLADWGAEVILVESRQLFHPGHRGMTPHPKTVPDDQRIWSWAYPGWEPGERPYNRTALFNSFSRNRLGVTVDLRRPEGAACFKELVQVSDVVIENNSSDLMDRLGLGYDALAKIRPDLIMVRMPAYGLTGPYSSYRAWGSHIEGLIGHTWVRGYEDVDQSMKEDVYPSDAMGGVTAAFSTVAALRHRDITGQGQLIDVALAEGLIPLLSEMTLDYTMNGRVQAAMGNRDTSMAPQGCYRCKGDDRWVTISVSSDEDWERLRRVMCDPEWAADARFDNVLSRWRNQDELDRHIEQWTAVRDAWEVMDALQSEGVAAGVVMDEAETSADPQLEALGFFQEVTHREAGTYRYPGVIGRIGRADATIRYPAPCLGEHNPYVYKELLGVSEEEYDRLETDGHVGFDYAQGV